MISAAVNGAPAAKTDDISLASAAPPRPFQVVPIEEEMQRSYLDYAMSVIVARALPDVRDGLKPVHRRILYAMREGGYDHGKPPRKSARIVGDVMGKYHPHGGDAIYDALVRLAQDFSMRLPLIDGQGNFGSMDGDPPAAMRYTEARLALAADALLADIDKDTVDFRPNYDESADEPVQEPEMEEPPMAEAAVTPPPMPEEVELPAPMPQEVELPAPVTQVAEASPVTGPTDVSLFDVSEVDLDQEPSGSEPGEPGADAEFDLVFHGGSGSKLEEIRETLDYGVVKMNVDTDTQYAFTRPIADHMMKNYDGVLKVDGEVGNKKAYDPRVYTKLAEESMAERVKVAVEDLRGTGMTLFDS